MSSRTDVQHHFGRVQAENIKLAGAPASMGEWVSTKATFNSGNALGTNAVNEVRYTLIGKTCIATYFLGQSSGAGTASGNLEISLPLPSKSFVTVNGSGTIISNVSGTGVVTSLGTGSNGFLLNVTRNDVGPSLVSSTVFGLDDNSTWSLQFTVIYEVA